MFGSQAKRDDIRIGFEPSDDFRTIGEPDIIDMVYFSGFACALDAPSGRRQATSALEDWVRLGLGFKQTPQGRFFDPVEVVNVSKALGLAHKDGYWRERVVRTARQLVEDFSSEPAPYEVAFTRTFDLSNLPIGKRLRLRLPLPLTSSHLSALTVFAASGDEGIPATEHRGRLEVRSIADGSSVAVTAHLSFCATGYDRDPALGVPDLALYLSPNDGPIVVTPLITRLSHDLVAGAATVSDKMRSLWRFCVDHIKQGAMHYALVDWTAPGDWVLARGWGDCQLVAALFSSLCRAQGIAARIVGGFYLYPSSPTNHYWAQAWVDEEGWRPFDFAGWELSGGGEDAAWQDVFYGRLDARMATECFPLDFTGALGVPIPPDWHLLRRAQLGGAVTRLLNRDATPIYHDLVQIKRAP